jgi:hypothetical protein
MHARLICEVERRCGVTLAVETTEAAADHCCATVVQPLEVESMRRRRRRRRRRRIKTILGCRITN